MTDGPAFTQGGKGLGCVRMWQRDARAKNFPAHVLIGAGLTKAGVDMSAHVFIPPGETFADQETLQECGGWSVGGVVYMVQSTMGLKPVKPSPSAIYYQARARAYGYISVWDGGCNLNEAWKALQERGIVEYEDWPHDVRAVNKARPSAYRKAADHRWLEYRWVLSGGSSRTKEACALLSSRKPLSVALTIDQGMEDWRPGMDPWVRKGPIIGGHAVQLVGYTTLPNGKVVFIYANSWGKLWGDGGFGLLSQEAFESPETTYIATPVIDPRLL